jgi:GAF domain-containing protein
LAVKQEISICVSDAQNDSRIRSEIDHLVTKDTRSALCSPFIFEGRAFGAVVLVNRSGGDSWQQGEVHIVSYVASHLAEYIAQSLETHEDFDAHFVRTTETAQQAAPPPTAPAARPVATAPQPAKAPAPQAQKNAPASAKKKQQRKKR